MPETEIIQDASVVARVGESWVVLDLLTPGLTDLAAIEGSLADLPFVDLCAMFTVNCDFSLLVRLVGSSTQFFVTEPQWASEQYSLGREVVDRLGVAGEYALFAGDPTLLDTWGISSEVVIGHCEDKGQPGGWDDLPTQVCRWLGLESLWGLGPETGAFLQA